MQAGRGGWTSSTSDWIRLNEDIEEIPDFLCRPVSEVHDKIVELEGRAELQQRIAETAKGAKG